MKVWLLAAGLLFLSISAPGAQPFPNDQPGIFGKRGTALSEASEFRGLDTDELRPALSRLSKFANKSYDDASLNTRGAKDAQIYKSIAPSVVLIITKNGEQYGLGSGTLINSSGEILTNWHVVKGSKDVGIIFKPTVEGQKPTEKDMVRGHVVRYDEVTDLALVKVPPPAGRSAVMLGDKKEIGVGLDVFAIGHPEGDDWTYTKGIISQYRLGYEWTYEDKSKHKADLIQTQTPINPGNSGGPLLSEAGTLIGVNSFKNGGGEGLNFAVALDEVHRFLARKDNREAALDKRPEARQAPKDCEPKLIEKGRSPENDADFKALDLTCDGKVGAVLYTPDDKAKPIRLVLDTNGDGKGDAWILDRDRDGKWDISFWATKFDGDIDLVGFHPDGELEPSSYTSFDAYKAKATHQAKQ